MLGEIVDVGLEPGLRDDERRGLGRDDVAFAHQEHLHQIGAGLHRRRELEAGAEQPATVLNALQEIVRAGASIGIPGLYVTGDPGGIDAAAKVGALSIRIGLGWAKSCSFHTGQCPVLRYNRQLMMAILHDKVHPAKACNATIISLDDAPQGYKDFDKGAAKKFVIDPHGSAKKVA